MNLLSNKKTETNTVELEIEVGAQELEEAMQAVFEREGKDITIQGFRKGKAPRKMIEKRFGNSVFLEDAVNDLYPEAYRKAVEESGIEPVAPGDVEILDAEPGKGFTFKATVTIKPEVKVSDYKGLEVDKLIKEVTDKEIDGEIGVLLERGARMVEVEGRVAVDGDSSVIDFEGFVDGVAFEGGKGENHELLLGSGHFIPGFEEQIVGKEIGSEFDVTVTFPEEYHSEDLAGKEAIFKVKLNSIKEKILPELDDEFAKDVSEFDTLDELKKDLRKNLEEIALKNADDALENTLVEKVIEKLEGEIPEVMYEQRIDDMVREFSQRLSSQGMNLDLYLQYTGMKLEDFRKTFRDQAEKQVKIRLALDEIVRSENITPSEEDIAKEYDRISEMYDMSADKLKGLIPADELIKDIAANQAIDLIRDSAKITEKTASTDEADTEEK